MIILRKNFHLASPSKRLNIKAGVDKMSDDILKEAELVLKVRDKVQEQRKSNSTTLKELEAMIRTFDVRQRLRWKNNTVKEP